MINEKRLDTLVNKLYSALNRVLDAACPKTTQKIIDKNNPWWIDKHHEARKQLTKLYKMKQRYPNDANITKYKEAKTEYAKYAEMLRIKTGINSNLSLKT